MIRNEIMPKKKVTVTSVVLINELKCVVFERLLIKIIIPNIKIFFQSENGYLKESFTIPFIFIVLYPNLQLSVIIVDMRV